MKDAVTRLVLQKNSRIAGLSLNRLWTNRQLAIRGVAFGADHQLGLTYNSYQLFLGRGCRLTGTGRLQHTVSPVWYGYLAQSESQEGLDKFFAESDARWHKSMSGAKSPAWQG